MRLFHVSNRPVARFEPRLAPPWSSRPGQRLVWAVDEEHLPLRLLPRACHRVHATRGPHTSDRDAQRHLGDDTAAVWVRPGCCEGCRGLRLHVHELPPATFEVEDASAGHHVSDQPVEPIGVRAVAPLDELAVHGVAVRVTDDLEDVVRTVTASTLDWSVIRAPDTDEGDLA